MVRISAAYYGELHCEAVHGPSQAQLQTDAPADNEGRGEAFSPTDLVATALGTCILTTMGIVARRAGIAIEGSSVTVDKEMTAQAPRRIARLTVHVQMAIPRSADPQGVLEPILTKCPVSRSLHPDVEVVARLSWKPEAP
ncbi:MAG: OsmC family protein [Opitutaceae bacterium]|nr:OsmC family protein [Opitutaceae bacterium]